MDWSSSILTIVGLALFETVSSIDNAIINADVLHTMTPRGRRWFLLWGLILAVFVVRGLLPWIIVWAVNPALGPWGALTATFSSDPAVQSAIEGSAPMLLMGGGVFLVFLFFHWLFLEDKHFGLPRTERFFLRQGPWFYAAVSVILSVLVWNTIEGEPFVAFAAVIGSTAFFITHGFKQNAEQNEQKLLSGDRGRLTDLSKILYLEVIDATFSIDGVIGAFAFTLAVPLILLGNGLGAVIVRQLTIGNIERIKRLVYLKNGAMYSILCLGLVMIAGALGVHVPEWLSPVLTMGVVGYFFLKSKREL